MLNRSLGFWRIEKEESMIKQFFLLAWISVLLGCSESEPKKPELDLKTKEQQIAQVPASGPLTFADIPNKNTTYETIEADSIDENDTLMAHLETELLKDQFDLFEKDSGTSWSENDCDQNKIIKVKGEGIRSYRGVSQVKVGDDQKTRPDFVLLVFAFDSTELAQQNFKTLDSAVGSGQGLCNGQTPEQLVLNGREIYYFTTRAEIFRDYINKYAEIVKTYK